MAEVSDELLDHLGCWDDMAAKLIARYNVLASRVVMYLAKPSILKPESEMGEIAALLGAPSFDI